MGWHSRRACVSSMLHISHVPMVGAGDIAQAYHLALGESYVQGEIDFQGDIIAMIRPLEAMALLVSTLSTSWPSWLWPTPLAAATASAG